MQILDVSAELINTNVLDPVLHINAMARTCYASEVPGSTDEQVAFVEKLIKNGHETPLEFVNFTFRIVTDRGTTHELVRHRLASYQQQSTRYVRYSKGISVIRPVGLTGSAYTAWHNAMIESEKAYKAIIAEGCPAEVARSVLPTCLATTICMNMNLRELRHFLSLRLSKRASKDMQLLARKIVNAMRKNVPQWRTLLLGVDYEDEE